MNNDSHNWMKKWIEMNSVWGNEIYQHCVDDGYEASRNTITEKNNKKLLYNSETLAMAIVVCFFSYENGRFMSRRELSIALDENNARAQDAKIVRDLAKLESFGLFIHNPPSGPLKTRYIEPTQRLISFFDQHCKGAQQVTYFQTKQVLAFISLTLIASLSHADEASADQLIMSDQATIEIPLDVFAKDEPSFEICFNTKSLADFFKKKKTETEDEIEELVS